MIFYKTITGKVFAVTGISSSVEASTVEIYDSQKIKEKEVIKMCEEIWKYPKEVKEMAIAYLSQHHNAEEVDEILAKEFPYLEDSYCPIKTAEFSCNNPFACIKDECEFWHKEQEKCPLINLSLIKGMEPDVFIEMFRVISSLLVRMGKEDFMYKTLKELSKKEKVNA